MTSHARAKPSRRLSVVSDARAAREGRRWSVAERLEAGALGGGGDVPAEGGASGGPTPLPGPHASVLREVGVGSKAAHAGPHRCRRPQEKGTTARVSVPQFAGVSEAVALHAGRCKLLHSGNYRKLPFGCFFA